LFKKFIKYDENSRNKLYNKKDKVYKYLPAPITEHAPSTAEDTTFGASPESREGIIN
jgi:hypothetical protein